MIAMIDLSQRLGPQPTWTHIV